MKNTTGKNEVKVSVVIVTHNHENFLASAIEGVLMQEVSFAYEIIITDDASTDGTLEIAEAYSQKHRDVICVLISEENKGPLQNGMAGFQKCKGEYIAWLDGDDRWTHPSKLEKQVTFLQENDEYSGCFHDAQIVSENFDDQNMRDRSQQAYKLYSQFNNYQPDFYPWDLLRRNIIPTASLVFKNNGSLQQSVIESLPPLSLSWAIHLHLVKNSKFKYFNEVWSVYNDHPKGLSKTKDLSEFKLANAEILKSLLNDKYYRDLKKDIYESLAKEYLQILVNPEMRNSSTGFFLKIVLKYLSASWFTAVGIVRYHYFIKGKSGK